MSRGWFAAAALALAVPVAAAPVPKDAYRPGIRCLRLTARRCASAINPICCGAVIIDAA